jgi:UDP-3-O-[3-hydroxymyristoyl] glucosamine N-acyltransferase
MTAQLGDLASLVAGQLSGDSTIPISGAAVLAQAKAGEITLADSDPFLSQLGNTSASAAIVPRDAQTDALPCIAVENVHNAFATIVEHFRPRRKR